MDGAVEVTALNAVEELSGWLECGVLAVLDARVHIGVIEPLVSHNVIDGFGECQEFAALAAHFDVLVRNEPGIDLQCILMVNLSEIWAVDVSSLPTFHQRST